MKGVRLAGMLLDDGEIKDWRRRHRRECETQLMYLDLLTPWYKSIMYALTPPQQKVMAAIMDTGEIGISPMELAKTTFTHVNIVTSVAQRLADYGLIERQRKGRKSTYLCSNKDLVSAHIYRSHGFRQYLDKHREKEDENLLDMYLCLSFNELANKLEI